MAAAYLAIDQGTTSSRAIVFGEDGTIIALAQQEFTQHYSQSGWVEHDAEEIWSTTLRVIVEARNEAEKAGADIRGIGITNQRETTIIWDRNTGEPIHRAIVWQDRRTAETCRSLSLEGHEDTITGTSGLVIDPYFSASKIAWILDHVKGARARAEAGELAFGTVESFLIWRLTGGQKHLSDATNAARTSLFDIENGTWDAALCRIFNVPMAILPEVVDCAGNMGETTAEIGSPCRSWLLSVTSRPLQWVRGVLMQARSNQLSGQDVSSFSIPVICGCIPAIACSALWLTRSKGAAAMRSKGRSSLPVLWCSGCVTGSGLSGQHRKPRQWQQRFQAIRRFTWCLPLPGWVHHGGAQMHAGRFMASPAIPARLKWPAPRLNLRLPDQRSVWCDGP